MSDNMNVSIHVETTANFAAIDKAEKKLTRLGRIIKEFNSTPVAASIKASTESLERMRSVIHGNGALFNRNEQSAMALLNRRFAFEKRMIRQQASEAKAAADASALFHKRDIDAIREKMSVSARFDSQRRAAEREATAAAERASNARTRAAKNAARAEEQAARDTARAWQAAHSSISRAMSRGSSAYGQVKGLARGVVAGSAGAAGLVTARGISGRMQVDSAETALRIFGDNGGKKFTSKDIAKLRSDWLDNEAFSTGNTVSKALTAFTEINKSGIKSPKENTQTLLKATSALELDTVATTKLMALIDRNLGSRSSPKALHSALNAVAVVAREDPTQAPEIVEGVKRGIGAMSLGNLSVEDLTALVSGAQSVGVQPGKAGTFIATLMKDLSSGGYARGQRAKDLNKAAAMLGFGNAHALARSATTDSYETIVKVMESLERMSPDKRAKATNYLSQTQWSDEDTMMLQGLGGMKHTRSEIHDPKKRELYRRSCFRKDAIVGEAVVSHQGDIRTLLGIDRRGF